MNEEKFALDEKELLEEYEDLVFRKLMAMRCEEESKEILAEMEKDKAAKENPADGREIEKIFSRMKRKENLGTLGKIAKKVFLAAASFVLVAVVSISSAVVASADVREAVTDVIYHLVFEDNEKYTLVSMGESTGFIDPELYDWEGAYAPTYMPEGYEFEKRKDYEGYHYIQYSYNSNKIIFKQFICTTNIVDTETATKIERIEINNSEAVVVYKDNKVTVNWHIGETMFSLESYGELESLIKIAESIKIIK